MPTITVFPDVPRAYNRVEINWADNPSVTHARVMRVDAETGICTPLRPYICFDGDAILLSCGHAIFWDTEVPLDRSVYYITESDQAPCIAASTFYNDNFNRNSAVNWATPDLGPAYVYFSGLAGQFTTTTASGGIGRIEFDAANDQASAIVPVTKANVEAFALIRPEEVATGAAFFQGVTLRDDSVSTNSRYEFYIVFGLLGVLSVRINVVDAGVSTNLGQFSIGGIYTATTIMGLRARIEGSHLSIRAWNSALAEPTEWQLEVDDDTITYGAGVGARVDIPVGNTNQPDFFPSYAYIEAVDLCAPCTPTTAETEPSTMPSNGAFRLKDPVRPCNDIYMPLCFDQSTLARHTQTGQFCAPGTGVFFASMETENYEPNALTVNPTNARRPIAITRQRRDVSSLLTVVSRTFADRDALLRLTAPGSPILLQGPPQYGIPDRYMDIGNVAIDRGLTDHRFQVRIVQMPHVAVDRPAGPQTGVCGSRVDDLCDFTFEELADGGNTWEDLVRGRPTGGLPGYRTWNDVLADFADWNAVDDGSRDWIDVETGS